MQRPTPIHVIAYATSFAMVGVCTGLALGGGGGVITFLTARTLGVVAVLAIYLRVVGVTIKLPARDRGIAVGIGLIQCLNAYLIAAEMAEIPVPLAVLIFYLWPAITSVASWMLGKEPFRWRMLLGLAAAFVGIALALNVEFTSAQAKGVAFAFASAFTWSLIFMLTGHFFHGRDTRPLTFHMMAVVGMVFLILCLVTGEFVLPHTTGGLLAVAAVPFLFAYAMIGLLAATGSLGPSRSGFYMNAEPVASVLLSAAILGQQLAPIQLVGAALVITALFVFRPLKPAAPVLPQRPESEIR